MRGIYRASSHPHAALLCPQGGSGQTIEWAHLQQPEGMARRGWLLAGGLRPENVTMAIQLTRPSAVDVSSGVCGPDGVFCGLTCKLDLRHMHRLHSLLSFQSFMRFFF